MPPPEIQNANFWLSRSGANRLPPGYALRFDIRAIVTEREADMRVMALAVAAMLLAGSALAGQSVIPDYDTARDDYFWNQLYPFGGVTIYCSLSVVNDNFPCAVEGPTRRISFSRANQYPAEIC